MPAPSSTGNHPRARKSLEQHHPWPYRRHPRANTAQPLSCVFEQGVLGTPVAPGSQCRGHSRWCSGDPGGSQPGLSREGHCAPAHRATSFKRSSKLWMNNHVSPREGSSRNSHMSLELGSRAATPRHHLWDKNFKNILHHAYGLGFPSLCPCSDLSLQVDPSNPSHAVTGSIFVT